MAKDDRQAAPRPPLPPDFLPLPWDSSIFSFSVAKICIPLLVTSTVQALSSALRSSSVELLYIDCDDHDDKALIPAHHELLFAAGPNIIFERNLSIALKPLRPNSDVVIRPYADLQPSEELRELAVLSGKASRFRRDPRIPDTIFRKFYEQWLLSSIADIEHCTILVAEEKDHLGGFVIAKRHLSFGLISLIAVHPDRQGRGIGRALISACERLFLQASLTRIRVVTQRENIAACTLYTQAGYQLKERRFLYHLWDNQNMTHKKSFTTSESL